MATKPIENTSEIDALRAELDALKAQMESKPEEKLPPMPKADPHLEEYVEVQLFYDGNKYKDDVFVAVNGETCLIKRGVPVKIKRKFKLALDASQLQDNAAAAERQKFASEYEQKKSVLS